MTDFTITEVRAQRPPLTFENGATVVGHLNVEIGPVLLIGARLILDDADDRIRLALPRTGRYMRVLITDRQLRNRIRAAAIAALQSADTPLATAYPVASGTE